VLPEFHRDALRDAAIACLDECFSAIAEGEPGQSYADTPIGSYLPRRYEHYYDGCFARDWATTIAVVGWKLAQPGDIALACVTEELALFTLIRHAQMLLDLRELDNDEQAWSDLRDLVFEDEDFLFLFNPNSTESKRPSGHVNMPSSVSGSTPGSDHSTQRATARPTHSASTSHSPELRHRHLP